MTRSLFSDWVTEVFGPTVHDKLREKDLPLMVTAHPPNLMEEFPDELSFIKMCLGSTRGLEINEEDVGVGGGPQDGAVT